MKKRPLRMDQFVIFKATELIQVNGLSRSLKFAIIMMQMTLIPPVLKFTNAEIVIIITKNQFAGLPEAALQLEPSLKERNQIVRRVFLSLAILSTLVFAPEVLAQSQDTDIRPHANRVIGNDLQATFAGQTHSGAYNFTASGEPTRFYEERHHKDGKVAYSEGDGIERGLWRVLNDNLCFLYDSNKMAGGCFRVYRVENCYYFYSANLIEREDELDRDYWTARSTLKGEHPKCEAALS